MPYKNAVSGIYQIKNLCTGKVYIGSSRIVQRRWHDHRRNLRNGIHTNPRLQNAWNKYGESNFEFSIIESCPVEHLLFREQFYISELSPAYNIADVVGMPYTPKAGTLEALEQNKSGYEARLAGMRTAEYKEKASKANKEVWTREGHRESRSLETTQLWNTPEYRMKQREAHRKVDEQSRVAIREWHKNGASKKALAERFNVSAATISRIILGLH